MLIERFKVKNVYFNNNVIFIDLNNRFIYSVCVFLIKYNGR